MTKDKNWIDITPIIQEYELANSPLIKLLMFIPWDWFIDILSNILAFKCERKITRYNKFKKRFKRD